VKTRRIERDARGDGSARMGAGLFSLAESMKLTAASRSAFGPAAVVSRSELA